jgi:hypothetical protein
VNDWPALGVDVTPQSNQEVKFLAYQPQDDLYITLVLHTAPGELDQWLPTALAIAESIIYSG